MKKQYFFIIAVVLISSIFLVSLLQYKSSALTLQEQRNLIGFAIGCKDALAGKSIDKTQFDKRDGLSNHSTEYGIGYFTGYNACLTNQRQ